jgi:hypothetical protein
MLGGFLIVCGAVLTGSAILKFKGVGTTVRPDRAASTLVVAGPYRITRNPMYLGLALVYFGIAIADQSVWALILLPVVLTIIQRRAIERRPFWKDVLAPAISVTKKKSGAGYNLLAVSSLHSNRTRRHPV